MADHKTKFKVAKQKKKYYFIPQKLGTVKIKTFSICQSYLSLFMFYLLQCCVYREKPLQFSNDPMYNRGKENGDF